MESNVAIEIDTKTVNIDVEGQKQENIESQENEFASSQKKRSRATSVQIHKLFIDSAISGIPTFSLKNRPNLDTQRSFPDPFTKGLDSPIDKEIFEGLGAPKVRDGAKK